MPEITDAQLREYGQYSALGTPEDVGKKLKDLEAVKSEAAERRKAAKDLEAKVAALESKVPEGATVLTGDEAKAFDAAKAAHGGVAELVKKAERAETAEQEIAKRDRQDGYRKAARTEGWDEDAALGFFNDSETFKALPFEIRQEQREVKGKNGATVKETVPVGYLTVDGKAVSVATWQAEHAKHWTPGLSAAGTTLGTATGREFIEQRGRSDPGTKKTDEDFKKATDSTANYTL